MSKDVIADFLTIVRNGIERSKFSVETSYSKLRYEIAQILKEEGFVSDVLLEEQAEQKNIKIVLKYVDGESVIHEITRVSKPSRRVYTGVDNVKPVISGLGVSILTTSKGVMTDRAARQHRVGGELICTIW
ncbi:MAG TPA: 30S ribosomal protein S8 [Candidatus Saccharimonadales bacterium]|nr:30S ribosomal protein S8 [Candidatus Saccharimonadales bacterium]